MNDPELSTGGLMHWLLAGFTSLLAFFGVRLYRQVDKLQDGHVTKQELKDMQEQNRQDRASLHHENTSRLERIETKIDIQAALVQRVTQVENEVERLRDWKHEVVDAYIPGEFNAIKSQINRLEDEVDDYRRRRHGP